MKTIISFLAVLTTLFGCRKDPTPLPAEVSRVEAEPNAVLKGMYVVNEGNMNMNKASLDYLDFRNGLYTRNLYSQVNPSAIKGLGDVANDIMVYGTKMYIVVNVSNKVEVLEAKTGKRLGQINVNNCRYLTSHQGRVYVSAYLGSVGNATAVNGMVAEIDTTNFNIVKTVSVGRQPEEMAIVRNQLYVANSGGYSPPNYERTLSVIDLNTFKVVKTIDVGINLHRIKADRYGDLYVTSRGDYYDIPAKLFVINTETDQVKKTFDIAANNIAIDDDLAYVCGTAFSYINGTNRSNYYLIDVKSETLLPTQFINDGTETTIKVPYGIAVNPFNKDVYLSDAKDYVTPGKLYCYNQFGKLKWTVTTGDIPAHMAFMY